MKALFVVAVLLSAATAAAQDQGLDLLLFAPGADSRAEQEGTASASTVQLYRFPLSVRLRSMDDKGWGVRVTFPVSLSSVKVKRVSDVATFVKRLGVVSIVPGLELEIPVGDRVLVRPFGEAGVGKGTAGGGVQVLYGAGIRVRVAQPVRQLLITYGGSAQHRRRAEGVAEYASHSAFEAGVDIQIPLGFSIRQKQARGGIYGIARGYDGLELHRGDEDPVVLRRLYEAGLSFSTAPELRIWKVRLPWLAVGYQFDSSVSGARFYFSYPF